MRVTALVFASVLAASGSAVAQEWVEYVNTQDGFKLNFPSQPRVTETTWTSQLDSRSSSARVQRRQGPRALPMTVVDYAGLEQQGIERSKTCPPGNAQCRPNAPPPLGPGYWMQDERGAIVCDDLQAPSARRQADHSCLGMAGHG